MKNEILYFPCESNSHGRILKKLTSNPMTLKKCELYLKSNYFIKWIKCEAIPQAEKTIDLHN